MDKRAGAKARKAPTPTAQARKAAAAARRAIAEAEAAAATAPSAVQVPAPPATDAKTTAMFDDVMLGQLDAILAELKNPTDDVPGPSAADDDPPQGTQESPEAGTPDPVAPLWARLVADPGFAPEHLARTAVLRLGPDAQDWATRMRQRYRDASPDGLARLAVAEHVARARRIGLGALFGGAVGAVTSLALLARTQARMVLTIAAGYGHDPTAEARGRELLDLLRAPRLTQPGMVAALNGGRLLGGIAIRRVAARLVPFGAGMIGVLHSGRSTEALAIRARAAYRSRP